MTNYEFADNAQESVHSSGAQSAHDALHRDSYVANLAPDANTVRSDNSSMSQFSDGDELLRDLSAPINAKRASNDSMFDDYTREMFGQKPWTDSEVLKDMPNGSKFAQADFVSQVLEDYGFPSLYSVSGKGLAANLEEHPSFRTVHDFDGHNGEALKPGDILIGTRDANAPGPYAGHSTLAIVTGPDTVMFTDSRRNGQVVKGNLTDYLNNQSVSEFEAFRPPIDPRR